MSDDVPENVGRLTASSVDFTPLGYPSTKYESEGITMPEAEELHPKVAAATKVQAFADKYLDFDHSGKLDAADAKIAGHWAWRLILLAAKFLPDHTVVGGAANKIVNTVDRVGVRGDLDNL
jgi:hypothetical protein